MNSAMKIAIIGTSNSIGPRGYVPALSQHPAVSRVGNFSLGHSTSIALAYTAHRINFTEWDFCVLDFSVNEEASTKKPEDLFRIESCLNYLLDQMAESGCLPVVLIMPTERGRGKILQVHEFYLRYATSKGLPLFDGFSFLRDLEVTNSALDASEYFRDPDHLAPWASSLLGYHLADRLSRIDMKQHTISFPSLNSAQYSYLPMSEVAPEQTFVERHTSLTSARFLHLSKNQKVVLEGIRPGKVVGIGININQTNALLRFQSSARDSNAFYSERYFNTDPGKFTFVIRVIPEISVLDKTLSLEVLEFPKPELAKHYMDHPAQAEVHGIAIEHEAVTMRSYEVSPAIMPLQTEIPAENLKR
ncbi:hypothetical protein [Roseomonas gilardii]|uniref:hypothetical protein n=1 Tax=Roseomonas gilardii TaxID=257708 RepID=UPI0012EB499C|nr:hypothetical protein [Roseomonas gilardii]